MKNATPIHHHVHRARKKDYLRILFIRTAGNFLILSSLFMIGKTFYEPVRQEVRYRIEQLTQKKYVVAAKKEDVSFVLQNTPVESKGGLGKLFQVKPVDVLVPEDPNFSVVIPKIGANARVYPGVDSSNEREYLDILKKGVAHALGTAFPGEGGHVFIFAHSTDYFWNVGSYNAIFYLLDKLEEGDEVNLFYKGVRHTYRVVNKQVVDPSQVEYLTRKTSTEFLTMQTCWPLGTTLKRLLVFAVRVAD